jgi:hypothetical protein
MIWLNIFTLLGAETFRTSSSLHGVGRSPARIGSKKTEKTSSPPKTSVDLGHFGQGEGKEKRSKTVCYVAMSAGRKIIENQTKKAPRLTNAGLSIRG